MLPPPSMAVMPPMPPMAPRIFAPAGSCFSTKDPELLTVGAGAGGNGGRIELVPAGKIVYSTFVGGATNVTPGLTSAPGLDSILVDSAGDVIIKGQAGTNSTFPPFPPAPAESTRML